MAGRKFMKSGGMAALVAGLAVLALPTGAQAQDHGQGRWNRGGGDATVQNNGGNADGGRRFRGEQSTPTPAPQAQVQAQPQRNWSRGDGNGEGAGGNRWRRDNNTVRNVPVPQAQAQVQNDRRNWSGSGQNQWRGNQWQGRNRDTADANRDNTRGRDDVARWRNDNDNRRDNSNVNRWSGNTWRGDSNANRWSGNNAWRGDRQNYAGNARNWNRDWRSDNRYDWRGYRNSNRNTYRLGAYYAPYRNYSYRRLSSGFYLDTLFFGSRYLIDDPWQYRLPPAYGPYRWVRYYDDALLVDTYTGEVVDVIYSFFW